MAIVIFVVYFLTEWLPIFAIYMNHLMAFVGIIKRQRSRLHSELTNVATTVGAQSVIMQQ